MVRFLLSAGADQEHKTDEMHTALMEVSMVSRWVCLVGVSSECMCPVGGSCEGLSTSSLLAPVGYNSSPRGHAYYY